MTLRTLSLSRSGSHSAGMRQAAAKLEAQLGPTDILIANAGIGKETSALDFKAEDITAQINVNLIGVANSVDAVLAGLRAKVLAERNHRSRSPAGAQHTDPAN